MRRIVSEVREGLRAAMGRHTLVLCALLAGVASPALAILPGDVPDKWRFSIGGMAADISTQAALSSTTAGLGATINFEDAFDLPVSKKVFRGDAYWHINERQFLDFGYVDISRKGEKTLDQDVNWGDYTFGTNSEVATTFKTTFPYVAWRYAFLHLEQVRISGSAGISYLGLSASVDGTGNVTQPPDPTVISGSISQKASINFPVPLVGLQLDWALNRVLMLTMYTRLIYIDAFDLRGGINETSIRLHWYFTKHFGMSAGLDRYNIAIKEYKDGDKSLKFNYDVSGGAVYLDFAF
jgi:hypothetical protein